MKAFRQHAVTRLLELQAQDAKEAAAAKAEAEKDEPAKPSGNRKQRRARQRFNKLLNRKLMKANSLGQGVSISTGPDGSVHVKVSKPKPEPGEPEK